MERKVKVFEELFGNDARDNAPIRPLRRGEKASITKGLDVLSEGQMAACYLAAEARIGRREDSHGRGDSSVTRGSMAASTSQSEDFRNVSGIRLSSMLGLKPRTVEYTVSKFRLLLLGQRSGTEGNVMYDKILDSFDKFQSIQKAEVLDLAESALTGDVDREKEDEYRTKLNDEQKEIKSRADAKSLEIKRQIRQVFNNLKQKKDSHEAARLTIMSLAKSFDLPTDVIKTLAKAEFKKDPLILRYWM
jgi:hypothetical protein